MAISIDRYVDINSASSGAGSGDSVPEGSSDIQLFRDPASGRYFTPSEYVGTVEKRADGKYYANGAEANVVTYQTSVTGGIDYCAGAIATSRINRLRASALARSASDGITHTLQAASQQSLHAGYVVAARPSTTPEKITFCGGTLTKAPSSFDWITEGAYRVRPFALASSLAGTSHNRVAYEFYTDAPSVVAQIGVQASTICHVSVDDVPVGTVLQGTAASGRTYFSLTFGQASFGLRKVTIRPSVGNENFLLGVYVPASGYSVFPSSSNSGPRVAFVGDSFTEGAGISDGSWWLGWAGVVQRAIKCSNTYNLAVGSTGFLQSNTGASRLKYIDRLQDVVAAAPDLLIVNLSVNDAPFSTADVGVAAIQYFRSLQSALPKCLCVLVGLMRENTGAPNAAQREIEIFSAISAANLPNLVLCRMASAAAPCCIVGNGTTSSPSGVGNADLYVASSDTTHPIAAGHAYLAGGVLRSIMDTLQFFSA